MNASNLACRSPYKTPDGMVDQFYVYVFDGSKLLTNAPFTPGVNYPNLSIQIDRGSDFVLRRVSGLDSVLQTVSTHGTGKYQLRDPFNNYLSNAPLQGTYQGLLTGGPTITPAGDFIVIPELTYTEQTAIRFDLYNTLSATSSAGVACGQIAFFGAQRWKGTRTESLSPWDLTKEHPVDYTYVFNIPITWLFNDPLPTRTFHFTINSYPFDLYYLRAWPANNAGGGGAFPFTPVQLQVYTANKYALFSRPINSTFFLNPFDSVPANQVAALIIAGNGGGNLGQYFNGSISPPISYPVLSQFIVDVTSLLGAGDLPFTLTLYLRGVQRLPGPISREDSLCRIS